MTNVSYRIELIPVMVLLKGLQQEKIKRWQKLDIGYDVNYIKKSSYITSVMAGLPLIPIVFDGTKAPWTLLDGKKRFFLLWEFYNNRFTIKDSSYLKIENERFFQNLPVFLKRKFCSTKIPCIVLNPPTSSYVINDIKERIKTTLD